MLVALNENQRDSNRPLTNLEVRMTGVETRLSGIETRLTIIEGRLNKIEGSIGVIPHGVVAIKNMLRSSDDPGEGPSLNGSPRPLN
ncbi:MAG TPA: hypothetical protein VE465_05375 [Streptosporangiaceae bacterium]|nr:hypothetical protein [Streptosporangiaceae bacterium]